MPISQVALRSAKKIPLYCFALLFIVACHRDLSEALTPEPMLTKQIHHGSTYIACAAPPYYFQLDSLLAHCSTEGSLPPITMESIAAQVSVSATCFYDNLQQNLGTVDHHNFAVTLDTAMVQLYDMSSATIESLDIEIDGVVYSEGQHPYWGGRRFSNQDMEVSVYVVNAYVGGCFHNVLWWEWKRS